MSDYRVKVERQGRSQKPQASPLFGFNPRMIAVFYAAFTLFVYALVFVKFGGFEHPIEYLYPPVFVAIMLALLPGFCATAAFNALTGAPPADLDVRTMVVIVVISAATYGAMAFYAKSPDQTP